VIEKAANMPGTFAWLANLSGCSVYGVEAEEAMTNIQPYPAAPPAALQL